MRALIRNMASATERMAFMSAQMAQFGLSYERIEAVTPATLPPPEHDAIWYRWQRPMRVTEMALCASHMAAWRRIVALSAPVRRAFRRRRIWAQVVMGWRQIRFAPVAARRHVTPAADWPEISLDTAP